MSVILSVVSGKGGVGKSLLAVNLAEVWAAEGKTVALLDADAGQTACATLMNETPRASADEAGRDPRGAWHPCASGVTLVQMSGDSASGERENQRVLAILDAQLNALSDAHDVVLIDAPAGVDAVVQWTLGQADLAALVVADEPTSVADAYRLVKRVWQRDPAYRFGTVVNFAETEAHGRDVWHRFSLITRRFTGNGPFYLGSVPFSTDVRRSVTAQSPFVRHHPVLAACVRAIAEAANKQAEHARHGLSLQ